MNFHEKKKLIISRSDQNVLIRKLFNERRRATKRRQWQSAILLLWGQLRISRTDNNKFSEPNEKKKLRISQKRFGTFSEFIQIVDTVKRSSVEIIFRATTSGSQRGWSKGRLTEGGGKSLATFLCEDFFWEERQEKLTCRVFGRIQS